MSGGWDRGRQLSGGWDRDRLMGGLLCNLTEDCRCRSLHRAFLRVAEHSIRLSHWRELRLLRLLLLLLRLLLQARVLSLLVTVLLLLLLLLL